MEFIIASYLTLEEAIIYLSNSYAEEFRASKIKILVHKYIPFLRNKKLYLINGDYYCVKYLHSIEYKFTQNSMEIASRYGHLNLIKFFVSIGIIPTSKISNLGAGNLQILKYLYTIKPKLLTQTTLWYAINCENYHTVQYLLDLRIKPTVTKYR